MVLILQTCAHSVSSAGEPDSPGRQWGRYPARTRIQKRRCGPITSLPGVIFILHARSPLFRTIYARGVLCLYVEWGGGWRSSSEAYKTAMVSLLPPVSHSRERHARPGVPGRRNYLPRVVLGPGEVRKMRPGLSYRQRDLPAKSSLLIRRYGGIQPRRRNPGDRMPRGLPPRAAGLSGPGQSCLASSAVRSFYRRFLD